MDAAPVLVVGIDVGGKKKGFHAVALGDGRFHGQFCAAGPTASARTAAWCRSIGARIVAIDAPCRWRTGDTARRSERELMRAGISCFSTPDEEEAKTHPTDYYGWMVAGMSLYAELRGTHPLVTRFPPESRERFAFETFPHAIACSAGGGRLSAKNKRADRLRILSSHGVESGSLTHMDWIDAALCGWAAHQLATAPARCKPYGDAESGYIIVPAADLKPG
jgi:predicted nuclease with RNAse H fold